MSMDLRFKFYVGKSRVTWVVPPVGRTGRVLIYEVWRPYRPAFLTPEEGKLYEDNKVAGVEYLSRTLRRPIQWSIIARRFT